ncbi:MAG: hypothetical protein COA73_13700 [Candidatus Hydrogenedentota bacterium]|nr:MAG: hypothetical protein COA73_13700 [Candidatus Hydrogenedentota bacterium]
MADGHYQVLARKWRPQSFDDVVGQQHITRTLQNAIRSGRISHAFLFIGSRGIGKTTSARILAKALNCLSSDLPTPEPCGTCANCTAITAGTHMDVIEIDGASNNSVDDVRQIRDNIRMVPTSARYKIYVIDEVHQLSIAAFNALLKTLEEPPDHAIFILATTEAHKIPATIISRCQRYDFRRVSLQDLVALLRKILDVEGIQCSDEALAAIARAADGGVRDSESILDQLLSYCEKEITFQDVFDVLGLVDWQVMHDLCGAVLDKDVSRLMELVDHVVVTGKDLGQFVQDILRYYRNLLIIKSGGSKDILSLPDEELALMEKWAERFTLTQLIRLVESFAELTNNFDSQLAQRTALEALLIKMSRRSVEVSLDTVLEKLALLQEGGNIPSASSVSADAPAPSATKKKRLKTKVEPPSPPTPTKISVSETNLVDVWRDILEVAMRDHMNLATWLPQAVPVRIEGATVFIEFAAAQDTARKIVEKQENRGVIEEALKACTENLTSFQCLTSDTPVETEESSEPQHGLPLSELVSQEDGKAVLEDPVVNKIVDVFKGQIVDIQHRTGKAT